MTTAHLNRIATAVPPHDIHDAYTDFARSSFEDARERLVFERMAAKAQIDHRFSVLAPGRDPAGAAIDATGVYARDAFPNTAERMRLYEKHASGLALQAVGKLGLEAEAGRITHLIVTSCTGLYAPGIDLDLIEHVGLSPAVERTMIGFMGCYAAINALKLAGHIVRSRPDARVLIVNLELCSLHLQQTRDLEQLLSFLLFADGCAASVVSADAAGFALDHFHAALVPDTRNLITWRIADQGFEMFLSGRVPGAIHRAIGRASQAILDGEATQAFDLWAVHPGGRAILDAVEHGLELVPGALWTSRSVLRRFGNMSSATVMFVLDALLESSRAGQRGCAMSFGPGLTAETMLFHKV